METVLWKTETNEDGIANAKENICKFFICPVIIITKGLRLFNELDKRAVWVKSQ